MALPAGTTYRDWLQNRAQYGSDSTVKQQAQALLQVVGNDASLNSGFVNDPYHFNGSGINGYNQTAGQIYGYGPQGMERINSNMFNFYKDPNAQWTAVQGASTTTPNSSGYYSGGSGSSYDPAVLGQFDQAESLVNSGLGRLDNQLNIARGNVTGQYDNSVRDQDTQKGNAETSFKNSSTQNVQNLRTNKNTISDQASNGLRGLMRMLGAYGAVGSDMGVAGRAVADQASQQRAGAGQVYAGNQSDLDTNWGNYQSQWNRERQALENWKQNQLNSVESQGLQNRQSLLSKLADIKSQRAALLGGNASVAAQPFLDQASALNGQIDNLGRTVQAYAGTAPTYQAKPLSSYDAGTGSAAQFVNNGQGGGGMTPYLSLLLGKDKKQGGLF